MRLAEEACNRFPLDWLWTGDDVASQRSLVMSPDSWRRLIDGMTSDGGGYVLTASHTIPPETPVDNIFAMYAEAGITRQEALDRAADIRARLQAGAG